MVKQIPITTAGFGTMSMTWMPQAPDKQESIKALKYVYEQYGVRFFNGGEFYQMVPTYLNLELLRDFCKEVNDPELVVSIKGGINLATLTPDGSKESIDKSIDNIWRHFKDLPVKPKLIFEMSRVDPKVPYEDTISYIYDNVKAGKIDGISLTEVSAQTIRKVADKAPISVIEEEFSLFATDIVENGVLAEAFKFNIPIVAYSPLCRGILTDFAVEHTDFLGTIDGKDVRKRIPLDKFTSKIYEQNSVIQKKLYDFAHSKGVPLENLALGYINKVSESMDYEGIPKVTKVVAIPSGSSIDKIDRNFKNIIKLSDDDLKYISQLLNDHPVVGHRYNQRLKDSGLLNA